MDRRAGRALVSFILILLALGTVLLLVSGNNPFATRGAMALTTSGSAHSSPTPGSPAAPKAAAASPLKTPPGQAKKALPTPTPIPAPTPTPGQEAVADTGPNANPNGNTGANSDTMAHTPADSNTSPNANPNGNTDTHTGANADANRATNPGTDPRPDADPATGRHPGDAGGQLIVRADPLDVARQRRSRPDLPQRTLDR